MSRVRNLATLPIIITFSYAIDTAVQEDMGEFYVGLI